MGKKNHPYADIEFKAPIDEEFCKEPLPVNFVPGGAPKCFACNYNLNSKGIFARGSVHCPLCGGLFCSKCMKQSLVYKRLFGDSPRNICGICMERVKERQHKRQQEKKIQTKELKKGTNMSISSPTIDVQQRKSSLPSRDMIDTTLEKFMNETNVPDKSKGTLREFSDEKKWEIICSYQMQQNLSQTTDTPSLHIANLEKPTIASAQSLRFSLGSCSLSWLEQFISFGGISLLLNQFVKFLDKQNKTSADHQILNEYVLSFFSIANIQIGFQEITNTGGAIETLVQSLAYFEGTNQIKILEMLAGMALISEKAHEEIVLSLDPLMGPLLDILTSTTTETEQKEAVLTLLNALINRMEDAESSTYRKKYNLDLVLSLLSARPPSRELHTQIDTYQTLSGFTKSMPIYSIDAEENLAVKKCKELTGQLLGFTSLIPFLSEYFEYLSYLPRSGESGVLSWKFISNCIQCAVKVGPIANESDLCRNILKELCEVYDISIFPPTNIEKPKSSKPSTFNVDIEPLKSTKQLSPLKEQPKPTPVVEITKTPVPVVNATATVVPPPPQSISIPIPPLPPGAIPAAPTMGGPGGIPKKPVIKPNIKMRKFNWTKINYRAAQNTFWEDVDESNIKVNTKQLEAIFGMAETKKTAVVNEITKPKTIHLLETKRSQNLSIVLSRYSKIPLEDLVEGVKELDEKLLNMDNAIGLLNSCPTAEEMEMMIEFTGEKPLLDRPEQYVLLVASVPRYRERLESLVAKHTFSLRQQSTHERLELMDNAIHQIQENETFKKILTIILAVGNYMNGNTISGGAFGFRLTSLTKMVDCRSPTFRQVSLLHYAIRLFHEEYPEVIELPSEFTLVSSAAKFDIAPIVTELNTDIAPSILSLKKELDFARGQNDTVFLNSFEHFYEGANEALKSTKALAKKLTNDFESFVCYFAEDKKLTFKELLNCMDTFINQFNRAVEDNIVLKKQILKKQQLQEIQMAKDERGILDSALGNLRNSGSRMSVNYSPSMVRREV